VTILRTITTVKTLDSTSSLQTNTASGGTDTTYSASLTSTKSASVADTTTYGVNLAGDAIETTLIKTQVAADALAAYLAGTMVNVSELVAYTIDNDSSARLDQIRDIDLNDRISATESVTGTTVDGFVEQIEHVITNGGNKHSLRVMVSARSRMMGVYSASSSDKYALSTYSANSPVEPPAYAVYGY
jgi:hypothetical protein